ncbi:hypothetical protein ACQ86G_03335 [Roseateles chitinivorans]|uniref:hypothetical protein n=1 Tax=Roseateles chitinivorans TaxID=2917965 RepID=UPI003D6767E4
MNWKDWFSGDRPSASTAEAWLPMLDARSGHSRQEAVEALGKLRAPAGLPGLLARVNDWVPQVRRAAGIAVRGFLADDRIDAWPAALPALADVLRGQRADHGPLLATIATFLVAPGRLDRLADMRGALPPVVGRWLDTVEWRAASPAERPALLSSRLRGADIVAARWALERIEELPGGPARSALWLAACDSPTGPVRAHALRRLCDTTPELGAATAQRLALDPRGGVRDVALAFLRRSGGTDPVRVLAESQLQMVGNVPHGGAPAFAFLAAVDPASTTARAERLLSMTGDVQPAAPLRAVALDHLIRASVDARQQHWLRRALGDTSPRVQRVAADAVGRGVPGLSPVELWPLVMAQGSAVALRRGLRMSQSWGLWTQFGELLDLARQPLAEGVSMRCSRRSTAGK